MTKLRLPYIHRYRDRHGKVRHYFKRRGQRSVALPGQPGSEAFMAAYQAALDAEPAPIGEARSKPGSVSSLIARYYLSSEFLGTAKSTQTTRRGILERFRVKHGDKTVANINPEHLRAVIAKAAATPAAANNLLKVLRLLMAFAVEERWRKDNPAIGIKSLKTRSDGFHTWTEPEILKFEGKHAIGSRERLAFGLLLYTAQRRSDVVRMGRQHLQDGRIIVRQAKTGARVAIPLHDDLRKILDADEGEHLTFLTTAQGKPFTPAGFGNWFADAVRDAALPRGCSAHGLRKAAARRLAEAGCTAPQIQAITGHRTLSEVQRYIAAADQARLADQAMERLEGPKRERKLLTQAGLAKKSTRKPLKRREEK